MAGDEETAQKPRSKAHTSILEGYLRGQLANACSFGVFWTLFSPVVLSLFNATGVGASRVAYSGALFIISPLAGVVAEKGSFRSFLMLATSVRGLVYFIFIPGAWILLIRYFTLPGVFYAVFIGMLVVDGVFVSLGNVLAIDCGGLDLLAQQYHIEITDVDRNRFNSLFQAFFDGSMIVLSPALAVAALVLATHTSEGLFGMPYGDSQSAILGGALAISIGFLAIVSLIQYGLFIPRKVPAPITTPTSINDDAPAEEAHHMTLREIGANIWGGFIIFLTRPRIRWRLMFMALEVALEDAMVVLLVAEYAVEVLGGGSYTTGNLWAAGMVATGKIGAVAMAVLMNSKWTPPSPTTHDPMRGFRTLFATCMAAGVSVLGLPIAYYIHTTLAMPVVATVVAFVSCVLFFTLVTVPKIGFATLLQSMASEENASGRVFGFAATFITATDALMIMGMSQLFSHLPLQTTFWICAGIFAFVGLVEGLFGPWLMEIGAPFSIFNYCCVDHSDDTEDKSQEKEKLISPDTPMVPTSPVDASTPISSISPLSTPNSTPAVRQKTAMIPVPGSTVLPTGPPDGSSPMGRDQANAKPAAGSATQPIPVAATPGRSVPRPQLVKQQSYVGTGAMLASSPRMHMSTSATPGRRGIMRK